MKSSKYEGRKEERDRQSERERAKERELQYSMFEFGRYLSALVFMYALLLFHEPVRGFEGARFCSISAQHVRRKHIAIARSWGTSTSSPSKNLSIRGTQMAKVKLKSTESNGVDYTGDLFRAGLWFTGSAAFCGLLSYFKGANSAVEFASGYFLEQALSIDNLFVFILLFNYFKVPKKYEARILRYGILGAVVLRGIFILVGTAVLRRFHHLLILFAVLLGTASYRILYPPPDSEEEDLTQNAVVKFTQKFFKTTDRFIDDKFFVLENGEAFATPLFLCLVSIELCDIVFAFDSVPAIFGITEDPLVVYTSNMFSIASLRALYGALSTAVKELEYLEKSVGIILAMISFKLCFSTLGVEILTPVQSLIIVIALLGGGALLSVVKSDQVVR